ncbi:hypothetical protein V8F33_010543 [Rhypophila sp. PSN 637]
MSQIHAHPSHPWCNKSPAARHTVTQHPRCPPPPPTCSRRAAMEAKACSPVSHKKTPAILAGHKLICLGNQTSASAGGCIPRLATGRPASSSRTAISHHPYRCLDPQEPRRRVGAWASMGKHGPRWPPNGVNQLHSQIRIWVNSTVTSSMCATMLALAPSGCPGVPCFSPGASTVFQLFLGCTHVYIPWAQLTFPPGGVAPCLVLRRRCEDIAVVKSPGPVA